MTQHDVISAFVDDEPFDPQALADALAAPDGRELLIDILALRHLTALEDAPQPARATTAPRWSAPRLVAAAAVLALTLLGGYQLGVRGTASADEPPPATLVLSGEDIWQDAGTGGRP